MTEPDVRHPDVHEGDLPGRSFAPIADPATRPRKVRRAVRVILVDSHDRVLLLQDSDPGLPGTAWWVTPGGGIDPGETEAQTAVREVAEETGYVLDPADLVGPLARRHVVHGYSDEVLEQDEVFYLARVRPFVVQTEGHTEEEKLTLQASRWWTRSELADTSSEVWPGSLLELWARAKDGLAEPLELGHMEESTVADVAT